ncbi:MAG: tail fiber domain-containing protein [Acidobacteriota bacterium]
MQRANPLAATFAIFAGLLLLAPAHAGTLTLDETATPTQTRELLVLQNNGMPRLVLNDTSQVTPFTAGRWAVGLNGGSEFIVSLLGTTGNEFRLRGLDDPANPGRAIFQGEVYAASFNTTSDRNLKTDITPLDGSQVLDTLLELPVASWRFKEDPLGAIHLGPMAQDFFQAFGTGSSPVHLSPLDVGSVALAAIQGLHAKVEDKQGEVDALSARVEALEALVLKLTGELEADR